MTHSTTLAFSILALQAGFCDAYHHHDYPYLANRKQYFKEFNWQPGEEADNLQNALYAVIHPPRVDPIVKGCEPIEKIPVQPNGIGVPGDAFLLLSRHEADRGRLGGKLTTTTVVEEEWLELVGVSDFACLAGVAANISEAAPGTYISHGNLTKKECAQRCRDTWENSTGEGNCVVFDGATNTSTRYMEAKEQECILFYGPMYPKVVDYANGTGIINGTIPDFAHCVYIPRLTPDAMNATERLEDMQNNESLVSTSAEICGVVCTEHEVCETAVFNDDTGDCYGYVGYDVLLSGNWSNYPHIQELAFANITLLDCAMNLTRFCPRRLPDSSAAAKETWPTHVACPVRKIGAQCDPCKIGNSQIPFDALYNEDPDEPTMYCEDVTVSMSVDHADEDERERLACFSSIPYGGFPTCVSKRNELDQSEQAQWQFAFVASEGAGVSVPLRCPDATKAYQDSLQERFEEFNQNGTTMTFDEFRKDYTDFVRGHHADFFWSLGDNR